ncbi:MAG TPA: hypothetical protein VGR69_07990 [Candidatus Rubrimentiphilum sp.]|nr:hypothetical protein [Candidatus Rubrimentiphilum sp.]
MFETGSRAATARIALLCAAAALLLLPAAARSARARVIPERMVQAAPLAEAQTFVDPWNTHAVQAVRNPFLFIKNAVPAHGPTHQPVLVRAVLVGAMPRALVEIGGLTRIVQTGQNIDTMRIARIGKRGLWLSNGVFLPLESHGP